VTVIIVILDDAGHYPHSHLVETNPFCGFDSTMAKSMVKGVKALEMPVEYLLAILDPCHEFLELR